MNEASRPTLLDLFTGIGGFSLAFEAAGFRVLAHAEIDPHASRILSAHWPQVPNVGDVTKLCRRAYDCQQIDDDPEWCWCPRCNEQFGECFCIGTDQFTDTHGFPDVLTAGVPCQPASLLGARRGTTDERWLWPDTLRIVRELSPRICLFENPPALLTLHGGRAINGIISELSALGYVGWYDVFPAAAVGAGHLRERLFIIAAHTHDERLERYAGHESGSCPSRGSRPFAVRPIAPPLVRINGRPAEHWLKAESPVAPLVHGLPAGLVKAACTLAGNAVVPQLAQIFAQAFRSAIA